MEAVEIQGEITISVAVTISTGQDPAFLTTKRLQKPRVLRHTRGMESKNVTWTAHALSVLLLIAAILTWSVPVRAGDSLFAGDEIFDLIIRVPFTKLMRQAEDISDVAGHLELSDGTSIPMTCKKYGISRLRECQLASLEITVEANDVRGTPFEGRRTLRLVTPCRLRGGYDRYTVLEYLVYRSYVAITEPALQVRLVRVHFQDSEKPAKEETGYAFFVEDIGHAAERGGRVWLDIQSHRTSDLEAAQLTLMTLFQYMVGNTDWSAAKGIPDKRCCHNVAIFGREGVDLNTVLPFDFDQAGLVDAPYAVPAASLDIRRVTERLYRGLCGHNHLVPAAVAVFNERRSEIEALFNREDLPYPPARQRASKYIDGFYDTINDPRKLEKKILSDCR